MANNKMRYLNTKFWNDSYISMLDPIEKLLFVYLLTNGHTNISGFYELPLKIMAVETGIDVSMFNKILPRLEEKINYKKGFVIIKNFIKHQETGSVNVQKGILNCLSEINIEFLKEVVEQGHLVLPKYCMDSLCIPYVEGRNYSYSDLDSNLNLDSVCKQEKPPNKPNPLTELFGLFWEEYPIKKGKKLAESRFMNLTPIVALKIIDDVKKRKVEDHLWLDGYAPHPPTYLNQEVWNDVIITARPGRKNNLNDTTPYTEGKYKNVKETFIP